MSSSVIDEQTPISSTALSDCSLAIASTLFWSSWSIRTVPTLPSRWCDSLATFLIDLRSLTSSETEIAEE